MQTLERTTSMPRACPGRAIRIVDTAFAIADQPVEWLSSNVTPSVSGLLNSGFQSMHRPTSTTSRFGRPNTDAGAAGQTSRPDPTAPEHAKPGDIHGLPARRIRETSSAHVGYAAANLIDRLTVAEARAASAEKELKALTSLHAEANSKIDALENEIHHHQKIRSQIESELQTLSELCRQQQSDLNDLVPGFKQMSDDKMTLKDDHDAVANELIAATTANVDLVAENAELKKANLDLISQVPVDPEPKISRRHKIVGGLRHVNKQLKNLLPNKDRAEPSRSAS